MEKLQSIHLLVELFSKSIIKMSGKGQVELMLGFGALVVISFCSLSCASSAYKVGLIPLGNNNGGNVYVTGKYQSTSSVALGNGKTLPISVADDVYIVKYDTSGDAQWVETTQGAADDRGYSIAVDSSGNVYVTGNYYIDPSGSPIDLGNGKSLPVPLSWDAFIIKYQQVLPNPVPGTILTRGGTLLPDLKKYTRFGESLDVSGDGTRLIASRLGAWSNGSVDQIQLQSEPLEIAELWDQDQSGNWSKKSLAPLLPIVQSGSLTNLADSQSPIAKISDSGRYFLYGVSELSGYGSNVAVTTPQQFSPILTLIGAPTVELILGVTYKNFVGAAGHTHQKL